LPPLTATMVWLMAPAFPRFPPSGNSRPMAHISQMKGKPDSVLLLLLPACPIFEQLAISQ
jgi:hypothetical protein